MAKLKSKIFCISFQRVGTTQFGRFLRENGFKVAGWKVSHENGWSDCFYDGKLNEIVRSKDFSEHQVFEDGPWFQPYLVKFLFQEFPDAKFIHLTRPPEDWFRSMVTHSGGITIGQALRHCEAYDRLEDYLWLRDNFGIDEDVKLSLFDKPTHYMNVYRKKTLEMKTFFEQMDGSDERVFSGELYNPELYPKIASFLSIENPVFPKEIAHRSPITAEQCVKNITDHLANSVHDNNALKAEAHRRKNSNK